MRIETCEPFQQLREPSKPIPAEITAITGIDDAMVAGKRIDPDQVAHAADGGPVVSVSTNRPCRTLTPAGGSMAGRGASFRSTR